MVNGRFKCLGTCQHLKDRFGRGYNLAIQVSARPRSPSESIENSPNESRRSSGSDLLTASDTDMVASENPMCQVALNNVVSQTMRFVTQSFPEAQLIDRHQVIFSQFLTFIFSPKLFFA